MAQSIGCKSETPADGIPLLDAVQARLRSPGRRRARSSTNAPLRGRAHVSVGRLESPPEDAPQLLGSLVRDSVLLSGGLYPL